MDTTTRRVRSLVYTTAAAAYGYRGLDDDEQSRDLHPEGWCSCGHHTTEHHGPHGDGECSAAGCLCGAMRSTA